MNITITFRHMVGTPAVKQYAHDQVAQLQRALRQTMSAQVTLSVEGMDHVADVKVAAGAMNFHANARKQDMNAAIDAACSDLNKKIRQGGGQK